MIRLRLWIDDERFPPDGTWIWVKTAAAAMHLWETDETVEEISFDHDLGEGGDTRMLATAILGMAHGGQRRPPRWYVHSANPVGVEYLTGVLERADRYWRQYVTKQNLDASYARKREESAE